MDRGILDQLRHMMRPHATRIANMVARAVVQLADDTTKLRLLQLGVLFGETVDSAEHFEPYGFSSVPLAGAEAVVVFPGGDRSHPLVIATSDRRYRPTGANPGEVTVYNNTGAKVTITKDGDIVAHAASGRSFSIDDGSGAAALPTMADFNGLVGALSGAGVGSATNVPGAITAWQAGPPTAPVGTKVLKAK